jgi:hypothetical protein
LALNRQSLGGNQGQFVFILYQIWSGIAMHLPGIVMLLFACGSIRTGEPD